MSNNDTRLRWLIVIVVVELLVIIGLLVWAVVRPDDSTGEAPAAVSTGSGVLSAALVATGLNAPINIATTPNPSDDRLFINEQAGVIKSLPRQGGDATTFLDITSKVKSGGEMGLLGLAFHPKFAENGYFYVNYIDHDDNTIIARYQVKADGSADAASEKVLLKLKQPYANHNGGALAFGPDGFLYIALGDGGSGGDPHDYGQAKNTLLGKILRIDVDSGEPYAVPATNPFVGDANAKPEIWAYGLRNPWRFSFDRETGDLYIGDVGQDKMEEVSMQSAGSRGGENYGWRCYEGTLAYNTAGCGDATTYTAPILAYEQTGGRRSVAGGYVYRGEQMPNLRGSYLFADTYSGEIFQAKQDDAGKWTQTTLLKTPYMITTFGEDQNGELYLADLTSGSIYKLETH